MKRKVNIIRKILVPMVFIVIVQGFSSCEKYTFAPPAVDPNVTWHFEADIQPIFTANCITCHGGIQSPNLSEGKSYLALTKGGYVNPPGVTSVLYHQMSTNLEHIPRSTAADKLKVLYWINQGALNN
jgi:hypothetical protein